MHAHVLSALAIGSVLVSVGAAADPDPVADAWTPLGPDGVEPAVLVVTDESLAEAWRGYAAFKTSIGLPTAVLTVQAIEASYEGDDTQAKLRAAALDYVEQHGTRYVVLGGDSGPDGTGLVPDRDTVHAVMGYDDIPTDLYYLSPGAMDWDADGDGVFGEWPDDMDAVAYTHPSGAAVARVPVRTAGDVVAFTEKVIAYETRYPGGGFAESLIYTNTVDASEPKVRRSWDEYVSAAWPTGGVLRFLHTETAWDDEEPGDFALNAQHWVEVINQRTAGKMHMHGHGFLPAWVLEHPTGNTYVDGRTIRRLANRDAYLVMTTVSCFTGQYDGEQDPSIVELMLRAPERGAVAVIAPSREGVPMFHNPRVDFRLMVEEGKLDGTTESMTRYWVNGLTAREGGGTPTLGEAFVQMKQQMDEHARRTAGYHWCQCELSFLGDPTLDMRAADPVQATLALPESVSVTDTAALAFDTGLAGVPGAWACVWQGGTAYARVAVDADGRAVFEGLTLEPGEVSVAVAGPGVNAVVRAVTVGEAAGGSE